MPGNYGLNLSGTSDIYASSVSVVNGDTYVNLMNGIQSVAGLPPNDMNSLQKLAAAINNDPSFHSWVAPLADPHFSGTVQGIDKTMVGLANVDNTSDSTKVTDTTNPINIALATKQPTLSFSSPANGYGLKFQNSVKGLVASLPLSLASNFDNLTISMGTNPAFTGNASVSGDFSIGTGSAGTLTIGGVTLDTKLAAKQNALTIKNPAGTLPFLIGTNLLALKASLPLSLATPASNDQVDVAIDMSRAVLNFPGT